MFVIRLEKVFSETSDSNSREERFQTTVYTILEAKVNTFISVQECCLHEVLKINVF